MYLKNHSKIIVNKSKFFGYLYEIKDLDEIKKILEEVFLKNKKFCHVCYGVFFDQKEIFKNNGEVGQPGKILLNILKQNKLNKHILIVARIHGGIKLGPAGVGKAFKEAGKKCLFC
jgi:putative IMPACT (imprinted ancient) family translation regulator